MGVTGLWPILAPSARPTPLAALNRRRLAVDASIWIYQFLKAVRDKEGNALRNSHIVGFFRRICKLLYYGIKPVFVFDGGAPVLKRQTILARKQRREGRREDAARIASKLLVLQMKQRSEKGQKGDVSMSGLQDPNPPREDEAAESIPADKDLVYYGEMGMSVEDRLQNRKFHKTDAYHLPELTNGIEGMGQPNDPRIMSAEELQMYAKQFKNGEDINLYDFSKIDFDGDFFMSLPTVDRYNILNAARLRSRLRMGLSKEQLLVMFPNSMDFSRFQIDRVKERNELTQRLMNLNGMNEDLLGVGGRRIAGDSSREYVLVKNEGAEGGWALGVVSTDQNRVGERCKPIDVDQFGQNKPTSIDSDEDDEFEDIPVEGLNRLPTAKQNSVADWNTNLDRKRYEFAEQADDWRTEEQKSDMDTLFVEDKNAVTSCDKDTLEEDEALRQALAMSLLPFDEDLHDPEPQYHLGNFDSTRPKESGFEFEYSNSSTKNPFSLQTNSSDDKSKIHITHDQTTTMDPNHKNIAYDDDSDDGVDLQAILAKARKQEPTKKRVAPAVLASQNNFDGPLPFEKLGSIFTSGNEEKKPESKAIHEEEAMSGGFEIDSQTQRTSKPLPPWLSGQGDIRSEIELQRCRDQELNAEDAEEREKVFEEQKWIFRHDVPVIIESSDEEDEFKPSESTSQKKDTTLPELHDELPHTNITSSRNQVIDRASIQPESNPEDSEEIDWSETDYEDRIPKKLDVMSSPRKPKEALSTSENGALSINNEAKYVANTESPSIIFEDIDITEQTAELPSNQQPNHMIPPSPNDNNKYENIVMGIEEYNEHSDPDDEELLAQLALEAEEHGRFAAKLNNKTEVENQHDYEKELQALRSQQKKDRRDADEITQTMITECQALLSLFGIPYITAPMEAEAQCAELIRLGLVDGVVTDDCDIFLFGGTRVYKNMFNSNKFVECYLAADIEKELSLSREQLISMAHLLGSDYTEGLAGIGPVSALEIISEFSSISEFAAWWSTAQYSSAPETSKVRKRFRRAQAAKLFLPSNFPSPAVTEAYWRPDVDDSKEEFQWGVPDLERLREFLMATVGWSRERTDEILVPVIRDMNRREAEGTQTNITRFFDGSVGTGVRGPVGVGSAPGGSKRMREAVGRLQAKKPGPARLERTFGDEAREWVEREQAAKKPDSATGLSRGKRKRASTTRGSNRGVADASDKEASPPLDEVASASVKTTSLSGRVQQRGRRRTKVSRKK
ncbi:unnamed protein product [Blumeria hordei]|uniref:Uncharacterized protein n=1 Tax=Blumeria hordei TaxID=2867405 RepID=A0A383UG94_BLUHO|nr:unnamed protein product [Blumeria hordei]